MNNKEQKVETSTEAAIVGNTLLPAVQRPKMANEALELLEDKIQIEVKNDKVFDLLRYFEKAKRNFKCTCYVNEFTEGWTVIVHGR